MLRARNKKLSMLLVLAMMMTMFVGVGTAGAAVDYQVLRVVSIPSNDDAAGTALGTVKVTIPAAEVMAGSVLTVSLPSSLDVVGNVVYANANDSTKGICVVVPDDPDNALKTKDISIKDNTIKSKSFDLTVNSNSGTGEAWFYVYFNKIDLNWYTGDVAVDFLAPANSGFNTAPGQVIAKIGTSGDTITSVKSVKTINEDKDAVDLIVIAETIAGTFDASKDLKIELATKGYTFKKITGDIGAQVVYGWGLSGAANLTVSSDGKKLSGKLTGIPANYTEAGRLTIGGIKLEVDPSYAKVGDVEAKISGAGITTTTVVIAKHAEYDITVSEDESKEIFAGKAEQEVGSFIIEEAVEASLLGGRTITLNLPDGAKWANEDISVKHLKGDKLIDDASAGVIGSAERMLRVKTVQSTKASKVKIYGMKVNVSPDFVGDLEVEVAGTAGLEGTIKLAEVIPAVTVAATPVDVIIGQQDQKAGVLTIKEAKDGALDDDDAYIYVELDRGFRFGKKPVVKVVEGDLDIDTAATKLTQDDEVLAIKVKSNSVKEAATIEVSDIYLTGLRYAPEGPVRAKVYGNAVIDKAVADDWDNEAARVVVANCITPAQGSGSAVFNINSNIYTVNGVAKVMDVTPYIKGDRTYVPVRYLAYALGVAEADVVWDEATQKVTLTKGDQKVELTIGSTTITVNGEAQSPMDVAPEIVNGRTMLPARYVAEGFGYAVGWDPGSRTVLISQ